MNLFDKIIEELVSNEDDLKRRFGFNVRTLTAFEKSEARKIFGSRFDTDAIRILEGARLPNMLDDLGRLIKGMPRREINVKNAITLGNHCFFGREIKTDEITDSKAKLSTQQILDMSWLIHELTHAWQYQSMGWSYLWTAWDAQTKLGEKVYDYGGEGNLKKKHSEGAKIKDFNLEQQGKIVQAYWERRSKGEDTTAYEPFIKDLA